MIAEVSPEGAKLALSDHHASALRTILGSDPRRWTALATVRSLGLSDCWVGAGFVRSAVWDHLHDRPPSLPAGGVDVVWFDPARADPAVDRALEATLLSLDPALDWSVKNQARMHTRNGDPPYGSTVEAMRRWPETATAVAVRRTDADGFEIMAPFGLDDLFALVLRPTPRFAGVLRPAFLERIAGKGWRARWPRLVLSI